MSSLQDNCIDIAFIQETWLRKSDNALLKEIKEFDYDIISCRKARKLDWGGGVAAIYRKNMKIKLLKKNIYKSFDFMLCKIVTHDIPINVINIYRPEYSQKHKFTVKQFLEEMSSLLEDLTTYPSPTIILGDFNFHLELVNIPSDGLSPSKLIKKKDAIAFINLIDTFDLFQLVKQPTHMLGGTLDLILVSSKSLPLIQKITVGIKDDICSTDHFSVNFCIDVKPVYDNQKHTYIYRNRRNLAIENVKKACFCSLKTQM